MSNIENIVILVETPFHLLEAYSLCDKIKPKKHLIIILSEIDKRFYLEKKYNFFKINMSKINFFNVDKKKYNLDSYFTKNTYLFTFYDTHIFFEFLKFKYQISWNKVGLIDDGIGNLYKVSMPKFYRRLPKIIYNFLSGRFNVTTSLYNLGSNKKISLFVSIFPNDILTKNKNSEIIDLRSNFKKKLEYFSIDKQYNNCSVIMLSPVLKYKRKTKYELIKYLNTLIKTFELKKPYYLKPHPREDLVKLTEVISKLNYKLKLLDSKLPIEYYFKGLKNIDMVGMPSTCFLTRIKLYKNLNDNYYIMQEDNDPFPRRIIALENFFIKNNVKYKII